jgi:hypothetical protein
MRAVFVAVVLACVPASAFAQGSVPVTADNFARAESDLYFGNSVKEAGGVGKMHHHREPMQIDKQTVIRSNRDTLYSSAVFDLDAGPVTIILPDAGKRFRSMEGINEDHYVVGSVEYRPGSYTFDRKKVGTRYVLIGLRTLVDPADTKDIAQVHALQDAIKVSQKDPGKWEIPNWDPASQKKVRDALLVLGSTIPDFKGAFGQKGQVDPIRHLIGTALGWGGNPDKEATYLNITPARNDGNGLQARREGRAGGRLLVDQPLQRRRLFPEERRQRLFAQQSHRQEERGRIDHGPVRRL